MRELTTLKYEVSERKDTPGSWGVEAIDAEGAVYMAIFSGPQARARAIAYAHSVSDQGQAAAA